MKAKQEGGSPLAHRCPTGFSKAREEDEARELREAESRDPDVARNEEDAMKIPGAKWDHQAASAGVEVGTADKSEEEADKSEEEADKSEEEAVKSVEEADKSEEEAVISVEEADKSEEEAVKSAEEAAIPTEDVPTETEVQAPIKDTDEIRLEDDPGTEKTKETKQADKVPTQQPPAEIPIKTDTSLKDQEMKIQDSEVGSTQLSVTGTPSVRDKWSECSNRGSEAVTEEAANTTVGSVKKRPCIIL